MTNELNLDGKVIKQSGKATIAPGEYCQCYVPHGNGSIFIENPSMEESRVIFVHGLGIVNVGKSGGFYTTDLGNGIYTLSPNSPDNKVIFTSSSYGDIITIINRSNPNPEAVVDIEVRYKAS